MNEDRDIVFVLSRGIHWLVSITKGMTPCEIAWWSAPFCFYSKLRWPSSLGANYAFMFGGFSLSSTSSAS